LRTQDRKIRNVRRAANNHAF